MRTAREDRAVNGHKKISPAGSRTPAARAPYMKGENPNRWTTEDLLEVQSHRPYNTGPGCPC